MPWHERHPLRAHLRRAHGPLLALAAALVLCALAAQAHTPLLRKLRPEITWVVYAGAAVSLATFALRLAGMGRRRRPVPDRTAGRLPRATTLLALGFLGAALILDAAALQAATVRARVNAADPAALRRVGRHVVVGFDRFEALRPLVARGLVGGIFVTARNVEGRSAAELSAELARLQRLRAEASLPPLLVMADQEGGGVSRLSPPLPRLPALSELVPPELPLSDAMERAAVYARWQARDLAAVGVNVNLAPVVDVPAASPGLLDPWGRIGARALGRDPERVAALAAAYAGAAAAEGVLPTLKHFPGLGRAREDTHLVAATVDADLDALEAGDWRPYRRVLGSGAPTAVMVGHARYRALDPAGPASLSRAVIRGILRERLGHQGLVVTDDLCMGPTFYAPGGIGASAVAALAAGSDLVLVSYDAPQLWPVLDALLAAAEDGRLGAGALRLRAERIDRALRFLDRPVGARPLDAAGARRGMPRADPAGDPGGLRHSDPAGDPALVLSRPCARC